MPTFSNIDGEESATVTFTVGTISLTRNSSAELQEILCLGDPEVGSSLGLARVVNTAPASTMAGLGVRIISGPSSVADFSVRAVLPSTGTDNPVSAAQASTVWAVQADGRLRAQNSTIGDLLASVQQNSTVWAVQADGRVRAQNSTIGDLLASVQQNSTVWQTQSKIQDSSGVGPNIVGTGYISTWFQSGGIDPRVGSKPVDNGYSAMEASTLLAFLPSRVGAWPTSRQAVDTRILQDVIDRTGAFITNESAVGGYPTLAQNTTVWVDAASPNTVVGPYGRTNRDLKLEAEALGLEP